MAKRRKKKRKGEGKASAEERRDDAPAKPRDTFHRPLEALKDLRDGLAAREAAATREAPAPEDPAAVSAASEEDVDFDETMKALGVEHVAGDARVPRREQATGPVRRQRPAVKAPEPTPPSRDVAEDSLDESTRDALRRARAAARRSQDVGERRQPAAAPTLDLHGFSPEDAVHEARRHVATWRRAGAPTVVLIPGRGSHSAGLAVVREAVERWLSAAPPGVSSWRRGRREEGGDGVLIVSLQRPRPSP